MIGDVAAANGLTLDISHLPADIQERLCWENINKHSDEDLHAIIDELDDRLETGEISEKDYFLCKDDLIGSVLDGRI